MAKDCGYTWNGVEWILTADNSGGGNCVCPAAHWGPEPDDINGEHKMTTPALCKGTTGPDLSELAEFAAIGGDKPDPNKPNHTMKSTKFAKLSKEWDKVMKAGMEKAGIKVRPETVGE